MKYLIVVLILYLMVISAQAEINKNAGTDAGQFLKIGVGARACGMGEAFSAVADDAYAIYYNPAGLTHLTHPQVSFMHNEWLKDLHYESLVYAKPYGLGIFGASITYLGMDDLIGRDKDGNLIGDFGAEDFAIQVAYGLMTDTSLSIGTSIKLIRQKIENEKATALAFDIGFLYNESAIQNLKMAFVIQNIGTKLKFIKKREDLPIIYRTGISYKMFDDRLILAGDLIKPADNDYRINLGTEYLLTPNLALRCGYNSKNDLDNGFSFGAGFKFHSSYLDYAYTPYGDLGNTHRISLSLKMPVEAVEKEITQKEAAIVKKLPSVKNNTKG